MRQELVGEPWISVAVAGVFLATAGTTPPVFAQEDDRPGSASPRAVAETFITALYAGDDKAIASVFDQSSREGKALAQGFALVARTVAANKKAGQAAQEKFGETGAQILHEELGTSNKRDPEELERSVREYLQEIEIFYNEAGERAVALAPGSENQFWLLERRDGRWYMIASKDQAKGMALGAGLLAANLEFGEKALAAIRESVSTDELREKLVAIRKEKGLLRNGELGSIEADAAVPEKPTAETPDDESE